jgi:hypothetical protein
MCSSRVRIAQLGTYLGTWFSRYAATTARWSLFCRDSNQRWWPYDGIGPTTSVEPLLTEVDADPTGIFWG